MVRGRGVAKKMYFCSSKYLKMNTANLKLYDLFRNDLNLNEAKALEFIEAIDNTISAEVKQDKTEIATKDFVKKEITEAKNDMIKWFVGLFITLALMILGLYATILLK